MQLVKFAFRVFAAFVLALQVSPSRAQTPPASAPVAQTVPQIVGDAYRAGGFDELDRLYMIYAKPGLRSELTGISRKTHFWQGIDKINDSKLRVTDHYYQQLDQLTGQWARLHPGSVLAQLLYVSALKSHAWAFRGNGYAKTVPPAAWVSYQNTWIRLWFNCVGHRSWQRRTVRGI